MIDRMDGFRFRFVVQKDGTCIMEDELREFGSVPMSSELGETLSRILAEQHRLRIDKNNQFARLHALIEIAQETELDKEVLIACINNSGDFE